MNPVAHANAVAIIPARLGSTRFPGKVLADATGMPLIRHVVESARRASSLARVVVATDDDRVRDAVRSFGGECVMTAASHSNGTSRIAEATRILGLDDHAVVVNVQGDEPEIEPDAIDAVVAALLRSDAEVATGASEFRPGEDASNPNVVKVVVSPGGRALYFSRALIPFRREASGAAPLRHVGLYVYRAGFVRLYADLPPTPLERTEVLEQLRVLEHGYRIAVARVACQHQGIDTPEQYDAFVARWRARAGA